MRIAAGWDHKRPLAVDQGRSLHQGLPDERAILEKVGVERHIRATVAEGHLHLPGFGAAHVHEQRSHNLGSGIVGVLWIFVVGRDQHDA